MSAHDALLFNIVTIQFFGGVIFTMQEAPYIFPQGSVPLAFALTVLMTLPMYLIYSVLSTSYPRSGGDYVFISRLVSPALAFVATFAAWVFWQFYFQAITPIQIMWEAISPFVAELAYFTGSPSVQSLSSWLITPTATVIICTVLLVLSLFVAFMGMAPYVKIQRIMVVFALISVAIALAVPMFTTQQSFQTSFNSFVSSSTGQQANWYQAVIDNATAAGYQYSPGNINLYQTFGTMVLCMIPLGYGFWSIIVLGEVKDAKVLKLSVYAIYGCVAIMGAFFTGMYILLQNVGGAFYGSLFYLYDTGGPLIAQLPFTPNFVTLITIAANNWVLDLLMSLGVALNLFNLMVVLYVVGARVMFAQSLDHVLPSAFSDLGRRFIAPIKALVFYFVGSLIFVVLASYYPGIFFYTTAMVVGVLLAYILAGVAAIVFPYKAKNVYKSSPISRYNVAGVPLIVILGILSLAFDTMLGYFYFTVPALGVTNPVPLAVAIAVYPILLAIYYINKWQKKRNGIEIDLAFKEIPPE